MKITKILLATLTGIILVSGTPAFAQKSNEADAAQTTPLIKWYSFEEAVKKNKKKPRKIFIDVYTDWCGWCKKMDKETFMNPQLAEYINENFYPVKLNAEQKEAITFKGQEFVNPNPDRNRSPHQLAIAILKQEMSYPSYVILDEKSDWLFKIRGYKSSDDLLPVLKYFGSNQYKVMSWTEFNESKNL
jgi:thioredoxin-related protein